MQWPRIAFAFMLILALVSALSVMQPNVSGQGYVTITTLTTTVGLYTYATATRYETTVLTTTSTYFSGPLPIPGLHMDASPPCGFTFQAFTATKGQSYSVSLTSPHPIGFYVMSDAVFKGWKVNGASVSGGGVTPCHGPPEGALVVQEGITSYSHDLEFPANGLYRLVFFQLISPSDFSIDFELHGLPIVFTSTVSSISYATAPTTELLALTTTVSAVAQAGLSFGTVGLLVVGAAVGVTGAILVIARRRKPSLTSQPITRTRSVQSQPIISTGYAELDHTLEGGVPEGFAVVIVSPSYDERDLLLRKVIESAISSRKPAFYISNDIGRTQDLVRRYQSGFYAFSSQADKIPGNPAHLYKIPGIENLSDASISLTIAIRDVRSKEDSANAIMILDVLSDILLRQKAVTTRKWLLDFVGKRKAEGFTVIATLNPLTTTKEEIQTVIDSFDGVIEIYEKALAERSRRFLVVKKMYGRRYSENELLLDKDKLF